jgi:hypothetical protein
VDNCNAISTCQHQWLDKAVANYEFVLMVKVLLLKLLWILILCLIFLGTIGCCIIKEEYE